MNIFKKKESTIKVDPRTSVAGFDSCLERAISESKRSHCMMGIFEVIIPSKTVTQTDLSGNDIEVSTGVNLTGFSVRPVHSELALTLPEVVAVVFDGRRIK